VNNFYLFRNSSDLNCGERQASRKHRENYRISRNNDPLGNIFFIKSIVVESIRPS